MDDLWHKRLGHPGQAPVCAMGIPSHNLPGHTFNLNKIHQLPFKDKFEHVSHLLDCVHIELVGPISPASISGSHYLLAMVDQFTSFKFTQMLKHKSEAFDCFLNIKNLMENQHDRKIKNMVSDNGGEFLNKSFKSMAYDSGFIKTFLTIIHPSAQWFCKEGCQPVTQNRALA
ncbi:hypothetical protein O181_107449 [Austropuccinia psidii MF-1]|uniref:Integrase catalytic domain-containing protein n=1 Tax=Austropuccinia psidii MF-1 TaxID=1389203 RepID=A0A9Q3JT42_9BASI|nr:hypothetical protein [Austropuccinia psidii MF-1]